MDSNKCISENSIPDGAKFEDCIPDGAKFEDIEKVSEPQLAGWCGRCGHKFLGQDEIFCPICGMKLEALC